MNNKLTEEEAKKALEALEAVENYQGGEYVDMGRYFTDDEVKEALRLMAKYSPDSEYVAGGEEIKPIKL